MIELSIYMIIYIINLIAILFSMYWIYQNEIRFDYISRLSFLIISTICVFLLYLDNYCYITLIIWFVFTYIL